MAALVYILCGLTSLACMVLLLRGYLANRVRLLLWASLCFAGLTINNLLLFVDLIVVPDVDLTTGRNFAALVGVCLLIYGLIWDVRE
jgi:hypothetical protein